MDVANNDKKNLFTFCQNTLHTVYKIARGIEFNGNHESEKLIFYSRNSRRSPTKLSRAICCKLRKCGSESTMTSDQH